MFRKMSDGMFLSACREVAKDFPDVAYDEDLLDRVCLKVCKSVTGYTWSCVDLHPSDCHKSSTILRPGHGNAQPLRRYLIRYVCWPNRWTWFDTFGQHRSCKLSNRSYKTLLNFHLQDASIFEAVHGSAPDIAGKLLPPNASPMTELLPIR